MSELAGVERPLWDKRVLADTTLTLQGVEVTVRTIAETMGVHEAVLGCACHRPGARHGTAVRVGELFVELCQYLAEVDALAGHEDIVAALESGELRIEDGFVLTVRSGCGHRGVGRLPMGMLSLAEIRQQATETTSCKVCALAGAPGPGVLIPEFEEPEER